MRLTSKWRRYLCSRRWFCKLTPGLLKCHNVQMLIAAKQQKAFIYGVSAGVLASLIGLGIACRTSAQAVAQTPAAPPAKQYHDSDRGAKSKQPVAFSDDTITITFHNCRENAKGHWSCQRVDGDDTDHYVYIPGLKPSTQRANPLADSNDKEDK